MILPLHPAGAARRRIFESHSQRQGRLLAGYMSFALLNRSLTVGHFYPAATQELVES